MSLTTTTTKTTSYVNESSAATGGSVKVGALPAGGVGIQLNGPTSGGGGGGARLISNSSYTLSSGGSGSANAGGSTSSSTSSTITSRYIKPVANSRTVVITRTLPGSAASSSSSFSTSSSGFRTGSAVAASSSEPRITPKGVSKQLMQSNVGSIKSGREREKEELRGLNERLANYIEKVRFLEAQNKKLVAELGQLRENWGKETEKVKAMYLVEMEQLRRLLTEAELAKGELEVRINSLEDQLAELEIELNQANEQHRVDVDTISKLTQQMADYDSEIALLRKRVAAFDEERKRDKAEIQRLRDELKRLRADLDAETLNHIKAENEAQSLRDELEFIKQVHDSQLKELAALAYRDTTQENRDYWKNEMAQALRDVQTEYDQKMEDMRCEIEAQYALKVQEVRTNSTRGTLEVNNVREENTRIKSQLGDLRSRLPDLEARNAQLERLLEELRREMNDKDRDHDRERANLQHELEDNQTELENVLEEMQNLMDAKLSLELEIAAYRKLLELEETRVNLGSVFDTTADLERQIITTQDASMTRSTPGSTGFGLSSGGLVNVSFGAAGTGGGSGSASGGSGSLAVGGSGFESREGYSITSTSSVSSMKTINSRTSKGNITIQECSPDGRFISLENTGKKKEELGGMKLCRNVDNGRQVIRFTIPINTTLDFEGKGKTLKIWAKGTRPPGSGELEIVEDSWGMGQNVFTNLTGTDGEEKATHSQKSQFSS